MGLDITAYRKLEPAPMQGFDADGEPLQMDAVRLYRNGDFPGRADDIDESVAYVPSDSFDFRAGSYRGYNQWREQLAELAGYPIGEYVQCGVTTESRCVGFWNGETGPFSELINFADNEGVIGASVAAKLAKDFAEYQAKADAHPDERFRDRYADWRRAFEMAADNGAVSFH
ncbi:MULTISPECIES: hypothetical protein [unclassified Rhodanobacter]|uniref:hypothetical protein n=1 Tax=unclassified Rhodanobacter TaxID=2621553 RepID=UPI001BDF50EF|nr:MULTISPECIES: hypothetical protein [unclassified Rhodanobacter]MBT2142733.1 hypothetical protein [Rhodanobacter sp. LX-99]MBT2148194.1 hypothetical protein [Rhodanobacter sp. LX-100]